MDVMGFMTGTLALIFALIALGRIRNIEKKLKQFDVIPRDFDSDKEPRESESK